MAEEEISLGWCEGEILGRVGDLIGCEADGLIFRGGAWRWRASWRGGWSCAEMGMLCQWVPAFSIPVCRRASFQRTGACQHTKLRGVAVPCIQVFSSFRNPVFTLGPPRTENSVPPKNIPSFALKPEQAVLIAHRRATVAPTTGTPHQKDVQNCRFGASY